MPELTVYRLTFPGGLHVGARGVTLEESSVSVPSDTLFAALLDAHSRTGEDMAVWFLPAPDNEAARQCPCALSSAFPFAGEVAFFPMPVPAQRLLSNDLLKARRKDVQHIRFISKGILRKLLEGDPLDDWLFPEEAMVEPETGVALQHGALWLTLEECRTLPESMRKDSRTGRPIPPRALREYKVYATGSVPRVTVDRIASASNIFHAGRVTFAEGCGLWFGVAGQPPAAFQRALTLLSEDGLGGERTAGYGAFTYEADRTLAFPDPRPDGAALLLSRYHPRPAELPDVLKANQSAYELVSISGWLRSWDGAAQRRRQLWLVREGSLVSLPGAGLYGDVVDVRPTYENPAGMISHPVWRSGMAVAVGLKEV